MSPVPAFNTGLPNAWLLAIVFLLLGYVPLLTLKDYGKKTGQGEHYGKVERLINVLFLALMVYSIFLPLQLRTAWFYSGLVVYLVGLTVVATAVVNIASTPLGQPFTKGIYRYSRNPGYLGQLIVFVGIGVASASWLYLLFSAILAALTFSLIGIEERMTLARFGDSYREYMNKTPRWLGIPRSAKSE